MACDNFIFNVIQPNCHGEPVILENLNSGCPSYTWDVLEWPLNGNGPIWTYTTTSNANVYVPYNVFTPGQSYAVKFYSTGASGGTQTFTFTGSPHFAIDFTVNGVSADPTTVCFADQPLTFTNTSTIVNPQYGNLINAGIDWDFGDGTTVSTGATSVNHSYASNGVYTVSMVIYPYNNSQPCPLDTLTRTVVVTSCKDGRICGRKFNDQNANGVLDLNEQIIAMPGWQIQLKDLQGNVLQTTTTSSSGSYCFNYLTPGDYVVCEINQSGWTQTFPSSPGTHTINLGPDQKVYSKNFGNHKGSTSEPCNVQAQFSVVEQKQCYLELNNSIAIGFGTDVIAIEWDFGDGATASGNSASHHYPVPGGYEVCMTVYALKDGECCISEYCQTFGIECEPKPCQIDGDFSYKKSNCTFDFSGSVLFANRDVDIWFWEFGDGTTAFGQNATHTFTPGSYTVCLTMISEDGEDCCMDRVCKNIYINDCGASEEFNSASNREGLAIESAVFPIHDLLIFPNPSKDIVNIHSELEGELTLRVFNLAGQLVKQSQETDSTIQLNLSKLQVEHGIYFIELSNGTETARGKLIYQ